MGEPVSPQIPAPYAQFDDFLDADDVGHLIDFIKRHEQDLSPSGVLAAPGDEHLDIRRSRTLFELGEIWPIFERQLVGLLPTIRRELNEQWFPLDHIERQLSVHHDGDFFSVHNDSGGPEVMSRRVTYVYYFNIEPKQFEGGELWVYDFFEKDFIRWKGDAHVALQPRHNSIVFFPSWVHHEVRPVHGLAEGIEGCRMTVNGWFHEPRIDPEPQPANEEQPVSDVTGV